MMMNKYGIDTDKLIKKIDAYISIDEGYNECLMTGDSVNSCNGISETHETRLIEILKIIDKFIVDVEENELKRIEDLIDLTKAFDEYLDIDKYDFDDSDTWAQNIGDRTTFSLDSKYMETEDLTQKVYNIYEFEEWENDAISTFSREELEETYDEYYESGSRYEPEEE